MENSHVDNIDLEDPEYQAMEEIGQEEKQRGMKDKLKDFAVKSKEVMSDPETYKQSLKTMIGVAASYGGVKSFYDVPKYFRERFKVRGVAGRGGINQSVEDIVSAYKTEGTKKENRTDAVKDLQERLSLTKDAGQKGSAARKIIAEVIRRERGKESILEKEEGKGVKSKELLGKVMREHDDKLAWNEERKNDLIKKTLDDYTETKINGFQAAKEALNTAFVASGTFGLRGLSYAALSVAERTDKIGKEIRRGEREDKGFRKNFINSVIVDGIKETYQEAMFKGEGTKGAKFLKAAKAWGGIARFASIGYSTLIKPESYDKAVGKILDTLDGKSNWSEVGRNFMDRVPFANNILSVREAGAAENQADGLKQDATGHIKKPDGSFMERRKIEIRTNVNQIDNDKTLPKAETVKAPEPKFSSEIKVEKGDNYTKLFRKALNDAPKEVQDKAIHRVLGEKEIITDETRVGLREKVVNLASIGNNDLNDKYTNVTNLIHEGDTGVLTKDGEFKFVDEKGVELGKDHIKSEAQLRENAEKIFPKHDDALSPEAEHEQTEPQRGIATASETTGHEPEADRIIPEKQIHEGTEKVFDKKLHQLFTTSPFGDQHEEYDVLKYMPASSALEDDDNFSRYLQETTADHKDHVGNYFDTDEKHDTHQLFEKIEGAKERIGESHEKESIKDYFLRDAEKSAITRNEHLNSIIREYNRDHVMRLEQPEIKTMENLSAKGVDFGKEKNLEIFNNMSKGLKMSGGGKITEGYFNVLTADGNKEMMIGGAKKMFDLKGDNITVEHKNGIFKIDNLAGSKAKIIFDKHGKFGILDENNKPSWGAHNTFNEKQPELDLSDKNLMEEAKEKMGLATESNDNVGTKQPFPEVTKIISPSGNEKPGDYFPPAESTPTISPTKGRL